MISRFKIGSLFLLAIVVVNGCDDDAGGDGGVDAAPDGSDTDTDTDSDSDSDSDGDGGEDGGGDAGDDAGEGGTDTDSGDGTCEPTATLLLDTPLSDTTEDQVNDLDGYSCTELDENGPDVAYAYVNEDGEPRKISASLTELEVDLDLFLLLETCDIGSCVAHSAGQGDEQAEAILDADETLFVVVDGFLGAAGSYTLQIHAEPVELICDDELDDDDDSLTDCADDDCLLSPACVQSCAAEGPIACGESLNGATTDGSDTIEVYGSYATDFTGPERIFTFETSIGGIEVEARLTSDLPDLELLVLADVCASDTAVLTGPTVAQFAPVATSTYFVIVDGRNDVSGAFDLQLDCREVVCDDEIDNDEDGLTDCEDPSCEIADPCIVPCNPLSPDAGCEDPVDGGGADAGIDGGLPVVACYPLAPDPEAGFCHPPSDAGVGAPCEMPYDCAPGMTCSPAEICLKYCDLDDGVPGCDAGDCTSVGVDPLGLCWD